jgi:hypothetical protein
MWLNCAANNPAHENSPFSMSNLLPQISKFGSDESHNNLLKLYGLVHRGHSGIAVGWVN